MNNRNLQTEGEMLPMNMSCSAGGDSLNRKESSADDEDVAEAKYVAAQEEMKGKASLTKYRFPECWVPNRELSQVQALFGQREVWRTQ